MSTCSPPPLMFGSSLMTAARHCICQPESISVSPSLNEPFIWGGKKRGRGNKWQTYYRSQYKYMPHFQRSCLRVNQNQPLRKEGKLTLQTPELTPCITWQTQPWSKSAAQTKGGQSPSYTSAFGLDNAMRIQHQNGASALIVTRWRNLALAEQLLPQQFLWLTLDDIQHKSERFARYCIQ